MMISSEKIRPDISLIFVNYRSAGCLERALRSLLSFEGDAPEIIIVNNDKEESAALGELQKTYGFSLIENEKNGGFGQGANIGAASSSGRILGFLNPDIAWQKRCLGEIEDAFRNDERIGIAGMQLFSPDGEPEAWSNGREPSLWRILRNNLLPFRKKTSGRIALPVPTDWVSGGALFIRKGIFQDLGGFDERFFLYFEDADLCRRVRKSGHGVFLLPAFPLVHYGGKSQPSLAFQKKQFYASQETYFKKHRPRSEYFFLRLFRFLRHGF
jgi:hypothetical protein